MSEDAQATHFKRKTHNVRGRVLGLIQALPHHLCVVEVSWLSSDGCLLVAKSAKWISSNFCTISIKQSGLKTQHLVVDGIDHATPTSQADSDGAIVNC
jgi:hypothetical protein